MSSTPLQEEIRELRSRFWSDRDPSGRVFAPLADAYRRANDLDEAAALLDDGLRRLPEFAPGHLVAARVFAEQGRSQDAMAAYSRVLELDPENVEALRGAATLADEDGRTAQALALLHRLARLESEDQSVRERIRELKARHFLSDEAPGPEQPSPEQPAAVPSAWAEDEPGTEGVWGAENMAAGDTEEAAEEPKHQLSEELTEKPEDEPVEEPEEEGPYTRTMAELYARQGHLDRARDVYRHLLRASPGDEEIQERLRELEARPSTHSYLQSLLAWPAEPARLDAEGGEG